MLFLFLLLFIMLVLIIIAIFYNIIIIFCGRFNMNIKALKGNCRMEDMHLNGNNKNNNNNVNNNF